MRILKAWDQWRHRPPRRARARCRPSLELLEDRCLPAITAPLILIPGEMGSFPTGVTSSNNAVAAAALLKFTNHMGLAPTDLTANISSGGEESPYASLISELTTPVSEGGGGYTLGVNFFVVAQDWRLPVAPLGASNSLLTNVNAALLTHSSNARISSSQDVTESYAVQYLGYWLIQANSIWEATHHGQAPPDVDMIAHSEGYPIARAYISSAAYGATYVDSHGRVQTFPKVGNFLALASPNEGSSDMVATLQNSDDFTDEPAYLEGRFEIFQTAYSELTTLNSARHPNRFTVADPDLPGGKLTYDDILTDGKPDPVKFDDLYFPAGFAMTPTYSSIYVNGQLESVSQAAPLYTNALLSEVNSIPNAFALTLGHMTAIFGYNQSTTTTVDQNVGTGGDPVSITTDPANFAAKPVPTVAGQTWYSFNNTNVASGAAFDPATADGGLGGDGRVPIESLVSTFYGAPNITLDGEAGITHLTVLSDPTTQALIISILQTPAPPP